MSRGDGSIYGYDLFKSFNPIIIIIIIIYLFNGFVSYAQYTNVNNVKQVKLTLDNKHNRKHDGS